MPKHLTNVQYLQNVAFGFEEASNGHNDASGTESIASEKPNDETILLTEDGNVLL